MTRTPLEELFDRSLFVGASMHTITTQNNLIFNYDGDITGPYGGIVTITSDHHDEFTVPAEDLFRFVAEVVRFARIDDLKAASDREVLGLPNTKG